MITIDTANMCLHLKESLAIYKKAVSMGYAGKDGTAVIEALLK
jgi:hypothetical protein